MPTKKEILGQDRGLHGVSRATVHRLPSYYRELKVLADRGEETVSCPQIAGRLQLDASQVRKDLAATGVIGRPKVGYVVDEVIEAIEEFLGWNNNTEALLVGAGNLGIALMGYEGFSHRGLNIVAAFDADKAKIGSAIRGKHVLPMEKLPDMVARLGAAIGILTVPMDAAQEIADVMVHGGIKAIWNFTPAHLDVPDEIIVENVRLSESLAILSNRLADSLKESSVTGEK